MNQLVRQRFHSEQTIFFNALLKTTKGWQQFRKHAAVHLQISWPSLAAKLWITSLCLDGPRSADPKAGLLGKFSQAFRREAFESLDGRGAPTNDLWHGFEEPLAATCCRHWCERCFLRGVFWLGIGVYKPCKETICIY